ncbi:Alpha/Beta hydrolase protein [Neohortaea acidophila]|uniref:Alpha/Beta hydrolase protein n=1 Tax=Neohortaea acidophila TaxID=245834 RepID=A0A6A6Q1C0_9PEZI|nr:Alpha/Beta hydrolase protein [Neohortaea acidophila]KAF2485786.1 Alpha/Beta hydrolase protein [Neohortaea acidophila]
MTEEDQYEDGTIPFPTKRTDTPCFTYYKIYGNLIAGPPPVIVLHGGPGAQHKYMTPFKALWKRYGLPVIFYDQIGCGRSVHLRHLKGDQEFWKIDIFHEELENLIRHFKLDAPDGSGYHLLGHSFGGQLVTAFAAKQPPGLQRLIIASASASKALFNKELWKLTEQLSPKAQASIHDAVEKLDFSRPAYLAANAEFRETFVCHARPYPPPLMVPDPDTQPDDDTVRTTVQGRSLWIREGTMRDYDFIPILHRINVPTLLYKGETETTELDPMIPLFEGIAKCRFVTIGKASHMPHLDSAELYEKTLTLVGMFLKPGDWAGPRE